MTSASCVAVTIHLSVTVSLQNIDGRVSVGISPNREVLVGQCPIQGIVLSILYLREVLSVRIDPKLRLTMTSSLLKGSNWNKSFVFILLTCS